MHKPIIFRNMKQELSRPVVSRRSSERNLPRLQWNLPRSRDEGKSTGESIGNRYPFSQIRKLICLCWGSCLTLFGGGPFFANP